MPLAIAAVLLLQSGSADSSALRHTNGLVPPAVTALRVDRPPSLDGRLDDPAWTLAPASTGLLQTDPDEGKAVSESTEVRIIYDADALYVGVRLFDAQPLSIVSRLGRRDANTHSDEFRLLLDSYHDHRTAFEFIVNPAGVKKDVLRGGDGKLSDNSWDPVWEAATSIDSLGWIVELRIPFSQLRFSPAGEQVWGVRFTRWIERKNELALFPFVGKKESGLASRFAHLVALQDIAVPKRLELLPYTLARGRYDQPKRAGNPFDDGNTYYGGAGLDLKYGVSSNFTLDATINPDFGQVELDPAYVNLTAFEQFLDEHRPFFVEGTQIFDFGGNGGGVNKFKSTPLFYYSRRIGREPQGEPTSSGDFKDVPTSTTILGAAKLSGRTADGWSVGVLDALTARERATVVDMTSGARYHDEVEPPTNYFVGRVKRDFAGGNTNIGFLTTAVHRRLDTPALDFLPTTAYASGLDFLHRWGNNTYTIAASVGASYIGGDTLAIQEAQRSSNRYFQRPDATSFRYEPHRTSLAGLTGDVYLNKVAGVWNWGLAGSTTTPGFEVNDFGFQERVDRISAAASVGRRWTRPGKRFRQGYAYLTVGPSWNYDGDAIQRAVSTFGYAQLRNFWSLDWSATYSAAVTDDRLTRGGPLAAKPAGWQASGDVYTDDRKRVSEYAFASYAADAAGGWSLNLTPQLTIRPTQAVSLSFTPGYFTGRAAAQYVTRVPDATAAATLGVRYVFAELRQQSFYVTWRLNATFSPVLSFQLYAQPFTFTGRYTGFQELQAPRTFSFNRYGQDNSSSVTPDDPAVCGGAAPGTCSGIDPDGGAGPAAKFALYNPDFRTRSFRTNAVLRWEYRPGSTLFLVLTHSRSGYFPYDASFDVGRDLGRELLHDRPTNILLVKFNYWLSL